MWLWVLILASLTASTAWGHQPSPPVVNTVQGKVLGKYVSLQGFAQPVAVFLGVPFAKPPLGALRFAPPQPAEPWSFVKNTTSHPPMCSQGAVGAQVLPELFTNKKESISEDCLYLNIYTPANLTKNSRLPVMVWIHGGGLLVGDASSYDGLALAAHEDVVVVIIQYRLGIWGFFSTGDEHSHGNWGHLDQVAALRWVQDNIASFGGNPGSVTIFGESAGGESVSVLVLSPLTKNLFHRAIAESGVALMPALVRTENVRPIAEKIAIMAGCKTTTSAAMVHCLRQKTEDELLEVTLKLNLCKLDFVADPKEHTAFLPTVVDGVLLPKTPEEILAEKSFNTVPYIVGFNKQEFGWIIPMVWGYPLEEEMDKKKVSSLLRTSYPMIKLSEELISASVEKYLEGTDDPAKMKDLLFDLMADVLFGVPAVRVSRNHRDAGAPTYMYEFQHRPSFLSDMKPKMVVGDHGDEVFFVFGSPFFIGNGSLGTVNLKWGDLDFGIGCSYILPYNKLNNMRGKHSLCLSNKLPCDANTVAPVVGKHLSFVPTEGTSEEEKNLSKMVMKFWANFARTGNPNGKGLPHWPEYDQKEGYLQIGIPTQAAQGLKDKEVAFWTQISANEAAKRPRHGEHTEL
ncbi:carboxylesterase 1D-like [Thomomys bottae]